LQPWRVRLIVGLLHAFFSIPAVKESWTVLKIYEIFPFGENGTAISQRSQLRLKIFPVCKDNSLNP